MVNLKNFSPCLEDPELTQKLSNTFDQMQAEVPVYIQILQDVQDKKGFQDLKSTYQRAQALKLHFDKMAVVGIGGSHLGAESFLKALRFPRNVIFMENPDPVGIARRFSSLEDVKSTHFVFVSKSGSTYETLAIANWVIDQLQQQSLDISQHCTVVTMDESSSLLRNWAHSQGVMCLDLPSDLSGQFSVLSASGLLPIYFALDVAMADPLQAALKAFADKESLVQYASLLYASIHHQYRVLNFWSYADQMQSFSKWWRQLWSESLGHKLPGDLDWVPICVLCRGASDQHSYLQQVIDQRRSQLNLIVTIKNTPKEFSHLQLSQDHFGSAWNLEGGHLDDIFKRESQALIKTFSDLEIPYLHLEIEDISLENLSYFVMQQQLAVALLGHTLGIDPYTQPAVEEMKLRIRQLCAFDEKRNTFT